MVKLHAMDLVWSPHHRRSSPLLVGESTIEPDHGTRMQVLAQTSINGPPWDYWLMILPCKTMPKRGTSCWGIATRSWNRFIDQSPNETSNKEGFNPCLPRSKNEGSIKNEDVNIFLHQHGRIHHLGILLGAVGIARVQWSAWPICLPIK